MFASKNTVLDSFFDGLGMGLGFTMALLIIGSIREIIGSGTWFGLTVLPASVEPMKILASAPEVSLYLAALLRQFNLFQGKKRQDGEEIHGMCCLPHGRAMRKN